MLDTTDQLRQRLQTLLQQTECDRSALALPEMEEGRAIYLNLFDSLTEALHNLEHSSAVETGGDQDPT